MCTTKVGDLEWLVTCLVMIFECIAPICPAYEEVPCNQFTNTKFTTPFAKSWKSMQNTSPRFRSKLFSKGARFTLKCTCMVIRLLHFSRQSALFLQLTFGEMTPGNSLVGSMRRSTSTPEL